MGLAGVRVGILDATNSTRERREYVKKVIREKVRKPMMKGRGLLFFKDAFLLTEEGEQKLGVKVMCIESICNDEELLAENIRTVKLNTPDYKDQVRYSERERFQITRYTIVEGKRKTQSLHGGSFGGREPPPPSPQPPELAMLDFLQRRENYKKHYESVTDLDGEI
jgi:hypothetical protein